MKYETPELTALTPAISAIQSGTKSTGLVADSINPAVHNEPNAAYADWE